jgi:DNA mismatch repair protein MutH
MIVANLRLTGNRHVISTLVTGIVCLIIFTLWEIYAPLKEPVVPMHLFKNIGWVASILLLSLGARSVSSSPTSPL